MKNIFSFFENFRKEILVDYLNFQRLFGCCFLVRLNCLERSRCRLFGCCLVFSCLVVWHILQLFGSSLFG